METLRLWHQHHECNFFEAAQTSAFARQLNFMDYFTANIKVKFVLKGDEPE
jgi:hypothetical protein